MADKGAFRGFRVRCIGCQEIVEIPEAMLGEPLVCGDCQTPIDVNAYPELAHRIKAQEALSKLEEIEQADRKKRPKPRVVVENAQVLTTPLEPARSDVGAAERTTECNGVTNDQSRPHLQMGTTEPQSPMIIHIGFGASIVFGFGMGLGLFLFGLVLLILRFTLDTAIATAWVAFRPQH